MGPPRSCTLSLLLAPSCAASTAVNLLPLVSHSALHSRYLCLVPPSLPLDLALPTPVTLGQFRRPDNLRLHCLPYVASQSVACSVTRICCPVSDLTDLPPLLPTPGRTNSSLSHWRSQSLSSHLVDLELAISSDFHSSFASRKSGSPTSLSAKLESALGS